MATDIESISKQILRGINKSEGYANEALHAKTPRQTAEKLREAVREILFMLEGIGAYLRHKEDVGAEVLRRPNLPRQ